jgi:hypothetical protein
MAITVSATRVRDRFTVDPSSPVLAVAAAATAAAVSPGLGVSTPALAALATADVIAPAVTTGPPGYGQNPYGVTPYGD